MADDEESLWVQNDEFKDTIEGQLPAALDDLAEYSDDDEEPPKKHNVKSTSIPDDNTIGTFFVAECLFMFRLFLSSMTIFLLLFPR